VVSRDQGFSTKDLVPSLLEVFSVEATLPPLTKVTVLCSEKGVFPEIAVSPRGVELRRLTGFDTVRFVRRKQASLSGGGVQEGYLVLLGNEHGQVNVQIHPGSVTVTRKAV